MKKPKNVSHLKMASLGYLGMLWDSVVHCKRSEEVSSHIRRNTSEVTQFDNNSITSKLAQAS